MKALASLAVLALAAAACATDPTYVAQADCKVAPITTRSATGSAPPPGNLEQRRAEMQLATSDYRIRNMARGLGPMNTVEQALRDCQTR